MGSPLNAPPFATRRLPVEPDVSAPDGSDVRILLSLARGSMAHFTLKPGQISRAIQHRSVDEIWYITAGKGEMWRRAQDAEEVSKLIPGISLTIPAGTQFQFRATGKVPLEAVAITMPPWPGEQEAVFVDGTW
jgi:mannose-6-phosphate isomerase-like protein (cupin superfamily)